MQPASDIVGWSFLEPNTSAFRLPLMAAVDAVISGLDILTRAKGEQVDRIAEIAGRMGIRITVVIPAYNEAENLPHVLPKVPAWVHEVILVDDHSTDETAATARELLPTIRVIETQRGRGKGAALQTGFAAATGEIIVTFDADGSSDPLEIPVFVAPLLAGADYAKGSRFVQGGGTSDMPWHRVLGNAIFVFIVRRIYGGHFTDLCYGYNAFWTWVGPLLRLDGDGFEIETMMNIRALRQQLRIAEVPSFEAARIHGIGRLQTIPDGWRVLKTIWRERTSTLPLGAADKQRETPALQPNRPD